jgi:flagellar biosynthetic protein FlhB
MAEENDPSSKTEEPTARRLDEARKRGEVAKSTDLSSWASLAGVSGVLAISGGWMCQDLAGKLLPFIEHPDNFDLVNGGAQGVAKGAAMAAAPALAMILGAGIVSGVAGNVIQQGFIWSSERLKPDLSKLNPFGGFGRLFGLDGIVQFIKSVLKLILVGGVAWMAMKPHGREVERLYALDPAGILPFSAGILRSLVFSVVIVLGLAAVLDWLWQRQRYMQRMRMSREELKEDMRQAEGDPHVKARQKQIRVQRARQRMMQQVPKATVVVTNPTHYAVALLYEQGETEAPVCVAKGLDKLALRIRAVAEENDVPVIEDPPLARALYAAVDVDQSIPVQHYEAVAKIIGFVLNAAKRRASAPRHAPSTIR